MICGLSTPDVNSRNGCSAKESDYLRLVGYGGLVDSMYCGSREKISIVVSGAQPLAFMFTSQAKQGKQLNLDFLGFNCKLACSGDEKESTTTTTTTTTTTEIDKIDKIVVEPSDEFLVQPMGVTKSPKPTTTTTTTASTTSFTTTTTSTTTSDPLINEYR